MSGRSYQLVSSRRPPVKIGPNRSSRSVTAMVSERATVLIKKWWFGESVGLVWWSALRACKVSVLTGRARRGLFETVPNLVVEHLLSVSAPAATYLVVHVFGSKAAAQQRRVRAPPGRRAASHAAQCCVSVRGIRL